jgi:hypothetical protein
VPSVGELDGEWPHGVPLQLHMTEADAQLLPRYEDLAAARELGETLEPAELFRRARRRAPGHGQHPAGR